MPTRRQPGPPGLGRLAALVAASAAVACGGCGRPSPAEPEGARVVLERTLDAWRDGQDPAELAGPAAGVRVGEPRWEGGYRLVGYSVGDESRPAGFDVQFTVALSMRDPRGEPLDETVRYIVSTRPARTVIRAPF